MDWKHLVVDLYIDRNYWGPPDWIGSGLKCCFDAVNLKSSKTFIFIWQIACYEAFCLKPKTQALLLLFWSSKIKYITLFPGMWLMRFEYSMYRNHSTWLYYVLRKPTNFEMNMVHNKIYFTCELKQGVLSATKKDACVIAIDNFCACWNMNFEMFI